MIKLREVFLGIASASVEMHTDVSDTNQKSKKVPIAMESRRWGLHRLSRHTVEEGSTYSKVRVLDSSSSFFISLSNSENARFRHAYVDDDDDDVVVVVTRKSTSGRTRHCKTDESDEEKLVDGSVTFVRSSTDTFAHSGITAIAASENVRIFWVYRFQFNPV